MGEERKEVEWGGVEWSGVGWSGAEWSGVEWSGVECSGVEWSGVEWSGVDKLRIPSKPLPYPNMFPKLCYDCPSAGLPTSQAKTPRI